MVLTWPGSEAGFRLETVGSLRPAAVWQPVNVSPSLADGRWTAAVLAGDNAQFFRLRSAGAVYTTVVDTSPAAGETGVAVTRETRFRFSGPLAPDETIGLDELNAEFGGRRLLARVELSPDRQTATLFHLENLPASAQVSVRLDGDRLHDAGGNLLDADGDGLPGGVRVLRFDTASISGLPGTAVMGRVFASEQNADGSSRPLANVTVTVDGAEETLRTTTDATGAFVLSPSPSGRFFVHVDGRTALGSRWPGGAYYPFVGKAWEAVPGRTNILAGGSGDIFLPLIQADALQTVSATTETRVTFAPSLLATNPALAGVEIVVPANSLFSDNGARGGKVGIAPVPPDRLPEPLPLGLELPLVITIQTDGAANFDTPVPVTFPNLPDARTGLRLGPGEKTVLWSFNHDTGRWEPQGTATISADGLFAVSDPGVGVRQPGWHGVFPGSGGSGPRRPPPPGPVGPGPGPCEGPDCECTQEIICVIPHEGRHYAICALSCLGNTWKRLRDPDKTPRSPVEDGLRCIGGPDKCPGKPEDVLTRRQKDCMDACRYPDSEFIRYIMPCEGYVSPCPDSSSRQSLHGPRRLGDALASGADPLAPGFVPVTDRLEEQFYIWAVEEEYLLRFTGTPKFVMTEEEELPQMNLFLDLFSTYVGADSEGGIHLSATERAELLGLPYPSQFTADEWQTLIDRLDSLQGVPLPPDVAIAKARLDDAIALLVSRGWSKRLDGLIEGFVRLCRARAPELGSSTFPARPHYYYLENQENGFVQRGQLSATGHFEGIILAADAYYSVLYYDPVARGGGGAFFKSRPAGEDTDIPTAPLDPLPTDLTDQDQDLVPDLVEQIVGTNPDGADSDGDGTADGAELASATNPLDGVPVTLGVRMVLDTPGLAVDVTAWNDLVAVADGAAGVALFAASNPATPVRLAQLATPGSATAVAGSGDLLAVAVGAAGIAVYEVSNATQPTRLAQKSLGTAVTSVAIAGDRVIAGLASGELVLLDVFGEVLQRLSLMSVPVQDVLTREGVVYSLGGGQLHTLTLEDRALTVRSSVGAPGTAGAGGLLARLRLTSDQDRLFSTHALGFAVFELTDPLNPVLKQNVPTLQAGWKQLVPDGSGLGIGAVNPNSTEAGPHDVSLFDLGPEGTNAGFRTTFPTPGLAWAVSLHEGMAYVADGAAGLTVISYDTPDLFGKPPAVSLSAALRPGPTTHMSRERMRLAAFAEDDVRLRSVEFLVDGERVAKFAAPPYYIELRAPVISATQTSFTLQARATDTGGNVALSPLQTVTLIPETVPPTLAQLNPTNGTSLAPVSFSQITATFSEPLVPSTFAGSHLLLEILEGETVAPVPTSLSFAPNNERVDIVFDPLPDADAARRLRLTISAAVTDTSGNPLGAPVVAEFPLVPVDRLFTGTEWGAAANWSKGLPGPQTPVVLGTAGASRVVQLTPPSSGQAFSVVAYDSLVLKNTLTVGDDAIFHQPLAFVGQSTLVAGGNVELRAGGEASDAIGGAALGAATVSNLGLFLMNKDSASSPFQILGTTVFRNEPEATFELRAGEVRVAAGARFENHGRLTHASDKPALLASARLDNFGRLEVSSGRLDLLGGSTHFGVVFIESGAALLLGNGFVYSLPTDGVRHEFAASSRLEGAGTLMVREAAVHFSGPADVTGPIRFDSSRGSITFSGITRLRGGLDLRGEFRNPFAGDRFGNDVTFKGLSAQLDQPVVLGTNSTLNFEQGVPVLLSELDAGPGSRLQGKSEFSVNGRANLDRISLFGAGTVRLAGPTTVSNLSVQGPNAPAAPKVVEFDGDTSVDGTHFFRQTLLRVGTNGTLTISNGGNWRLSSTPGLVELENRGVVRHVASARSTFDFNFVNQGWLDLQAGEMVYPALRGFTQIAGSTTIRGGHLNTDVTLRGGIFRLESGQFTGALAFFGGQLELPPNATLTGPLRVSGGTLALSPQPLTVSSLVHTNGTLRLAGSTLVAPNGYQNQTPAILTGHGTLETRGGGSAEISPGSPLGVIAFTGSYSFGSGSRFVVEIGGPSPGVDSDQLRVSDLAVDSTTTLDIRLVGGFSPPLGAEFPIIVMTSGRSAPRAFGTIVGLDLGAGKRFEPIYEVTGVTLRVVPAP